MKEFCKKCNQDVDFFIVEKSNQHTAYCNVCNSYLKNIPHSKTNESLSLYFGKYKDIEIRLINDRDYLSWVLKNCNLKEKLEEAVYNRILEL